MAKRLGCGVMEVLWAECLRMARTDLHREALHREPLIIHQTWKELQQVKQDRILTPLNGILTVLNVIVWYAAITL